VYSSQLYADCRLGTVARSVFTRSDSKAVRSLGVSHDSLREPPACGLLRFSRAMIFTSCGPAMPPPALKGTMSGRAPTSHHHASGRWSMRSGTSCAAREGRWTRRHRDGGGQGAALLPGCGLLPCRHAHRSAPSPPHPREWRPALVARAPEAEVRLAEARACHLRPAAPGPFASQATPA